MGVWIDLRYTGQYQDSESGLYYLRARYYDPATQQFLTRDPLAHLTGTAYNYADGSPVNAIDPSGRVAYFWGAFGLTIVLTKEETADLGTTLTAGLIPSKIGKVPIPPWLGLLLAADGALLSIEANHGNHAEFVIPYLAGVSCNFEEYIVQGDAEWATGVRSITNFSQWYGKTEGADPTGPQRPWWWWLPDGNRNTNYDPRSGLPTPTPSIDNGGW